MTPLERSYDTFFDLDQEIQIKRWLPPWELFVTELDYHAEFLFRHSSGYCPRLILRPLVSLFGPDLAMAVFLVTIGVANLYLVWKICCRLQSDIGPKVILFLVTTLSGAFIFANLTLDKFTLSLPLQLAIVNQYIKEPEGGVLEIRHAGGNRGNRDNGHGNQYWFVSCNMACSNWIAGTQDAWCGKSKGNDFSFCLPWGSDIFALFNLVVSAADRSFEWGSENLLGSG